MWLIWVAIVTPFIAYLISYTIRNAPFKALLKQATAFGIENFDINLREVINFNTYGVVKAVCAASKPINQYNHIEIFFAFAPWLLPSLDQYKREMIFHSLCVYSEQKMIEPFIIQTFKSELNKLSSPRADLQSHIRSI